VADITYVATTWANSPATSSKLNAANLNNLEAGVTAATGQANLALQTFRGTECLIIYTGTVPVRTTGTADTLRPVKWRGPTQPTIGGAYAIAGLDVWQPTP